MRRTGKESKTKTAPSGARQNAAAGRVLRESEFETHGIMVGIGKVGVDIRDRNAFDVCADDKTVASMKNILSSLPAGEPEKSAPRTSADCAAQLVKAGMEPAGKKGEKS